MDMMHSNLSGKKDNRGVTIAISYDALNRPIYNSIPMHADSVLCI